MTILRNSSRVRPPAWGRHVGVAALGSVLTGRGRDSDFAGIAWVSVCIDVLCTAAAQSRAAVVGFRKSNKVQSTMRRTKRCSGQTYMIAEAGSALDQEQQRAGRTGRIDFFNMEDAPLKCKGYRTVGPCASNNDVMLTLHWAFFSACRLAHIDTEGSGRWPCAPDGGRSGRTRPSPSGPSSPSRSGLYCEG
jgi:hypothetical protein